MAIASQWLGAHFNRPGLRDLRLRRVRARRRRRPDGGRLLRGGLARRAPSALDNLCWIYDNNRITIDGNTSLAFNDDVATRFIGAGMERHARRRRERPRACSTARSRPSSTDDDRPTLIIVDSHIGYGAPGVQDTAAAHGEPLGEEEVRLAKRVLRLAGGRAVPDPGRSRRALRGTASARAGARLREEWEAAVRALPVRASRARRPDRADAEARAARRLGRRACRRSSPIEKGIATRVASGKALNAIAENVPWLVGGAADLTGSTERGPEIRRSRRLLSARTAPAATSTSGSASTGCRPRSTASRCRSCGPTGPPILIFSDYAREPIRLSALMEIPAIWIFTHDSIGLGEDGPDAPASRAARLAARDAGPDHDPALRRERGGRGMARADGAPALAVALVLTRQAVPILDRTRYAPAAGLERGAYVLADPDGRRSGADPDRYRQRGPSVRRRPTSSSRPRARRCVS